MIILTPGTTASEVSTTVPEIVPMSTWATTGITASARINTPIHHRFEFTTYLISNAPSGHLHNGTLILLLLSQGRSRITELPCNGILPDLADFYGSAIRRAVRVGVRHSRPSLA